MTHEKDAITLTWRKKNSSPRSDLITTKRRCAHTIHEDNAWTIIIVRVYTRYILRVIFSFFLCPSRVCSLLTDFFPALFSRDPIAFIFVKTLRSIRIRHETCPNRARRRCIYRMTRVLGSCFDVFFFRNLTIFIQHEQ